MEEQLSDPSLHDILPHLLAIPLPFFYRWQFSLPQAQSRPPTSCLGFGLHAVAPHVTALKGFQLTADVADRMALVTQKEEGNRPKVRTRYCSTELRFCRKQAGSLSVTT